MPVRRQAKLPGSSYRVFLVPMTVRISPLIVFLLVCCLQGCFMLAHGSLSRRNMDVVLTKDNPNFLEMGEKHAAGKVIGALDRRTGDTVSIIGFYKDVYGKTEWYLILVDSQEVYISCEDGLTPDDQLFRRLSGTFSLTYIEDEEGWSRALDYVKRYSGIPIEIADDKLIKTKCVSDSTAKHYLVTRLHKGDHVEYEIMCRSFRPRFSAAYEARLMAFYMTTGRMYLNNK